MKKKNKTKQKKNGKKKKKCVVLTPKLMRKQLETFVYDY